MAAPSVPISLPSAAGLPASVKAALPTLTVMLVNGGFDLLAALLILAVGWTLSRWIWRWTHEGLDRIHYIDPTIKPLIANFVSYSVLAVTCVAVLGQFGVQTTSLIALVGATGLAIGLALQGTLSNVASGVMLLVLRPFRVSDKILMTGITGTVREIGLFRTALITDDGIYVSIPNATIFSGIILNVSRETRRRVDFQVDVDRGADLARTKQTILAALTADPRVLAFPKPDVIVDQLLGPQVLLSVWAWVQNQAFTQTQSDLRIAVREALNAAGFSPPIPIPAPPVAPWKPPAPEKPNGGDRAHKAS